MEKRDTYTYIRRKLVSIEGNIGFEKDFSE